MSDEDFGKLVPLGGGDPIPLFKEELLVGRSESNDICLRFPNVSARHCVLTIDSGYWTVEDIGSRNGTRINGHLVQMGRLKPNDVIAFSRHKYKIEYSPINNGAIGPPPPDPVANEIFEYSLLERVGFSHDRDDSIGSSETTTALPLVDDDEYLE